MGAGNKSRYGFFVAPVVQVDWQKTQNQSHQSNQSNNNDNNDNKPNLPTTRQFSQLQADYWRNLEQEIAAERKKAEERKKQEDDDDDDAHSMDTSDDDDEDGMEQDIDKEDEENADGPKITNIKSLFRDCVNHIDPNGSPLAIVNDKGTHFVCIFPDGELGEKLSNLVKDVSVVAKMALKRFAQKSQEKYVASNILPCPVHNSPLAVLLVRDKGCLRYTDAVSSYAKLTIHYGTIFEMDTENPEHKAVCQKHFRILNRHAESIYYAAVDKIFESGKNVPQGANPRDYIGGLLVELAKRSEEYAMTLIHIMEWTICAMLRIPYKLRPALMTPRAVPQGVECLQGYSFSILRTNLCQTMRNRHYVLCGKYQTETDATGREHLVRIGDDPDAYGRMELDNPPLEKRLQILARYNPNDQSVQAKNVMYGIYNGWISFHTLKEFMVFLSKQPFSQQGSLTYPKTEEEELKDEEARNVKKQFKQVSRTKEIRKNRTGRRSKKK